jgi:phosphoribosylpyrophosphate synthetase
MLESVREFDVYILNTGCGEINTSCVVAAGRRHS